MKPILILNITILNTWEVRTKEIKIVQILFEGTAEGPYFQGMILPGGVDTQKIYPDGSGVLNARYMLEGKDSEGRECRIFIDNTAELGSNETVPRIVTDSAILQKFAEKELTGEMEMKEGHLIIEIFEK